VIIDEEIDKKKESEEEREFKAKHWSFEVTKATPTSIEKYQENKEKYE